jgi:hypothetical protein
MDKFNNIPRQKIFIHYEHISKWINSSNNLEQLNACANAIESFAHVFEAHPFCIGFYQDLCQLYTAKFEELRVIEIAYIKKVAA